jgi:hypothetical protein
VGFIPVRCNVSPARTRAGARDVVGTPEQAAIVHRAVGTAPMARCLLEARLGVRGLRCDPVSGLRGRWLVRSRISRSCCAMCVPMTRRSGSATDC